MSNNEIIHFNESEKMREAYELARCTFKYFWRELYWERRRVIPALGLAAVKVLFEQGDHGEHMWLGDIDFDGFDITGTLMNEPETLTNVKQGDRVIVPRDEITDWLFSIQDRAYGGFTIQAIRATMSEAERAEHDSAWGLDFGDPDNTLVVYGQEEHPEYLTDHPMSQYAPEQIRNYYTQNPTSINDKNEHLYTALHREAIAGNKACIKAMLGMGADVSAKTDKGYTAQDFAEELEWLHILPDVVIEIRGQKS